MSLLLEALKKAEKAKEEAQRRAQGGAAGGSAAEPAPTAFDPETTVLDEGHQVTTRDQLPDISSQMEILSDDIQAPAKAPQVELRLQDETPPPREAKAPPRPAARPGAGARDAANADRATAQRVFEAKFKEPNPRLPFYITMAVLSAFAVGTVVYFWIQLRPPPSLVNTNPVKSSDEKPVDTSAAKPAAAPAGGAPAADAGAIPGLPSGGPSPASQPAAASAPAANAVQAPTPAAPATAANAVAVPAAPAAAVAAKPAASANARAQRAKPSAAADSEDQAVSVRRASPQVHPQVSAGYAAFQAGDLQKAREAYELVLREEPANHDALLGLAAVEMRAQRYDLSDAYYQRVLRADPRDPHALAGVMALRAQQLDPVAVESRVKSLLATDREANVLYFTLGNQYAQQGRWADAQQAYFKAFAADPANPDFAFNLAVSLDHLRQPALALKYYRKSLQLAEKRSAGFSADGARLRVQQLAPQGPR